MVARYLGVAPWDLDDRPTFWQSWALTALAAEQKAQAERDKRVRAAQRAQASAARGPGGFMG